MVRYAVSMLKVWRENAEQPLDVASNYLEKLEILGNDGGELPRLMHLVYTRKPAALLRELVAAVEHGVDIEMANCKAGDK